MQQPFGRRAVAAALATSSTMACSAAPSTCSAAVISKNNYQQRISSLAASIQPKVLVSTRGSGNYGEQGVAEFYTIDGSLPSALRTMHQTHTNKLERVDLDLGPDRLAFYMDNVLSHDEADALAACAQAILETNGHSRTAPGIVTPPGMRVNEAAHWYPSYDLAPLLLGPIHDRLSSLVPPTLDGLPLHDKLSEKIAHFKYLPNGQDQFRKHVDGLFPGQGANPEGSGVDEWIGVFSGMSMLFYLNDGPIDGLVGGETRLWSNDGQRYVDVVPKKGRVLCFRRGSPNAVLHAGLPVTGGTTPKYMALINLAYGNQTGTRPLM